MNKNKHQEALNNLKNIYEFEEGCQNPYNDEIGVTYKDRFDVLQELVDLSEERFVHILHIKTTPGFPNQIAFKTEKAAHEFAEKHNLKGCHLHMIQYAEFGGYDERVKT